MNELEQDKRYVFGDMIIVASIDANSNPILKCHHPIIRLL